MKERWADTESVNGPGSTLELTQELRANLPYLFSKYDIKTVLDAPCGDWNWMQHVDLWYLDGYTGWDVEPQLIEDNQRRFGDRPNVNFRQVNLLTTKDYLAVDLFICKDFLYHIDNDDVDWVLSNIKASGTKYLLATHMPGASNDREYQGIQDGVPGYFARSLDLCAEPFNMPPSLLDIREQDSIQPGYDMTNNLRGHTLSLFKL